MHMFPQFGKIEQTYGDRVIVVGVHSPKFPAERETASLREAVLRYRIEHPVVNDRDFAVWQRYAGRAWPTLMFIDPEGRVIGKHEGELPFAAFDSLVAGMLNGFEERGRLKPGQPAVSLEEIREPQRTLKFQARSSRRRRPCTWRTPTITVASRRASTAACAGPSGPVFRDSSMRRRLRPGSSSRKGWRWLGRRCTLPTPRTTRFAPLTWRAARCAPSSVPVSKGPRCMRWRTGAPLH